MKRQRPTGNCRRRMTVSARPTGNWKPGLRNWKEQVAALQEQNFDAAAREQAYKEAAEDLQRDVIGTKVMVMTISCTYNPADPEKRKITIITPDRNYDAIEIRRENEASAFKQLSGHMEKYIQLHDKEGGDCRFRPEYREYSGQGQRVHK